MATQRTADDWFNEYGESHQNKINKLIHWICVPTIFVCVVGFFWSIPVPNFLASIPFFNWGTFGMLLVLLFYINLSPSLSVGMLLFFILTYFILHSVAQTGVAVWLVSLITFIIAWIGQFIGHGIEGKKPSFFKDIVFLLIGPAWLMGFIYRSLGIKY